MNNISLLVILSSLMATLLIYLIIVCLQPDILYCLRYSSVSEDRNSLPENSDDYDDRWLIS